LFVQPALHSNPNKVRTNFRNSFLTPFTPSQLEQQGVLQGDFVVGLNNKPLADYGIFSGDQVNLLKEELKRFPRPFILNLNTLPGSATRARSTSDHTADAIFNRIDANNDGVITADELRLAVEQSSPGSDQSRFTLTSPQQGQGRIRCRNGTIGVGDRVDTVYASAEGGDGQRYGGIVEQVWMSGDCKIQYDDGEIWTVPAQDHTNIADCWYVRAATEEKTEAILKAVDTDGDGVISRDELRAAMSPGPKHSPPPTRASTGDQNYLELLKMACADGWLDASEAVQLESARAKHGITLRRHYELLALITGNGGYEGRQGIAEYMELLEMALADGWLSWGEDQRLAEARRRFSITPAEHYAMMAEVVESKGRAPSAGAAGSPQSVSYGIPCQNGMVREGERVQTVYTREEGGDGSSYSGTVERVFSNLDVQVHYDDGDRLTVPPQGGRADVYLLAQSTDPRAGMQVVEVNEVAGHNGIVRKGSRVRTLYSRGDGGTDKFFYGYALAVYSNSDVCVNYDDGEELTVPKHPSGVADVYLDDVGVHEVGMLECKNGAHVRKGDWVRVFRGGTELQEGEAMQLLSDGSCNIRFRDGITKTFPAEMVTKADGDGLGSNRVTIEDSGTPHMMKSPYAFDMANQSLVAVQHGAAIGTPGSRRAEVWHAETDGDAAWLGAGSTSASYIGRDGETYMSQNPEHHLEKRELQLHAVCGTPFAFDGGVLRHTMNQSNRTANVVLSNVALTTGKWYYEVRIVRGVLSSSQVFHSTVGWADTHFSGNHGSISAGDDRFSWGMDVAEGAVYHDNQGRMFGRPLREGDVLGVAANLDHGILSFSVNGSWNAPLGVAFGGQANGNEQIAFVGGLRPVISVAPGLEVEPTFSGGFEYPPPTADFRGVASVLTRPDASYYQQKEQYVSTGIASGHEAASSMSPGMMGANGNSLMQHSRSTDPSLAYTRTMAAGAHQALVSSSSRIAPRGRVVEQYRRGQSDELSPTGSRFKKTNDNRDLQSQEVVGYNVVSQPEKTRTELKLTANGWVRVPVAHHTLDRQVLVKENNGQALVWKHNYGTPELYQRYYLDNEPVRVIESDSKRRTVTVQFDNNPDFYGNKIVRRGVRWDELMQDSERKAKQQLEKHMGRFGQEVVHVGDTSPHVGDTSRSSAVVSTSTVSMHQDQPKFRPGDQREVALLKQIRGGPNNMSVGHDTLDEAAYASSSSSSFRGPTSNMLLKPRYGSTVRVGDEVKVRLPVNYGGTKKKRFDGSIDLEEVPIAQGVVEAVYDNRHETDTQCDVRLFNQGGRKVTVALSDIVAQRPGRTQTQYQVPPEEDITGCGSFIFSRFTFAN
jgi:Ca2+-binding EF-hand superfamily protein